MNTKPSPILTIADALDAAGPRPLQTASREAKMNYAEEYSRQLATCIANGLRSRFPGILPDPTGGGQETRARTSKGFKKLDVNYSTLELGLALGISVKTVTHPRYTHNLTRIENELRAEATDYHQRQPYTVLAAVIFLPVEASDDRSGSGPSEIRGSSSFARTARHFRTRAGRQTPHDDVDLFERLFIGLYDWQAPNRGWARFFDVDNPPPKDRRPRDDETLSFDDLMAKIEETYLIRNDPLYGFEWAP